MKRILRKTLCMALMFASVMSMFACIAEVGYAAVAWPTFGASKPLKTYTIATGKKIPTYDSNLRQESGRYLWDTDELYISSIKDGKITYTYPAGKGRRTSYNYLSLVTTAAAPTEVNTAREKITTYRRSSGSDTCGYISKGDYVYKLAERDGRTQVIYNIGSASNPTGWRMAWIPTKAYNDSVKTSAKPAADTLKITGQAVPGTLTQGSGFTVRGKISSNYKITKILVGIYDSNGKAVSTKTVKPNAKTFDVNVIDSNIHFSYAKPGQNYYRVYAWTTATEKKLLQDSAFTVKAKTAGKLVSPVPAGGRFNKKTRDWDGSSIYHDINRGVKKGTPVYAIADGTVTFYQAHTKVKGKEYLTSYGNYIRFVSKDGTYKAVYAHLNSFNGAKLILPSTSTLKRSGSDGSYNRGSKSVKAGDVIGYIGETGNAGGVHLHFEVYKKVKGQYQRIDPVSLFSQLAPK